MKPLRKVTEGMLGKAKLVSMFPMVTANEKNPGHGDNSAKQVSSSIRAFPRMSSHLCKYC